MMLHLAAKPAFRREGEGTIADTDSSESLSSWSTTREGGNHGEGADYQIQRQKSRPKVKLGIPDLESVLNGTCPECRLHGHVVLNISMSELAMVRLSTFFQISGISAALFSS
jgi:hypothetical protein